MQTVFTERQTSAVGPSAGLQAPNCVDRPIFVIGAPRSGTTVVYETLSSHQHLAWFSNLFLKFHQVPMVAVLSRLTASNRLMGAKKQKENQSRFRVPWPHAVECYAAWEQCCGRKFRFDFLTNQVATEEERKKTVELVARVMRFHGKPRFVAKITGPSRIAYLKSIFPDALFIHVVRDGRAVVRSLMKVDFCKRGGGYAKPWWSGGLTEEDMQAWKRHEDSPLVL